MARCGCSGACACALVTEDTLSVDMTLDGNGTPAMPWTLRGAVILVPDGEGPLSGDNALKEDALGLYVEPAALYVLRTEDEGVEEVAATVALNFAGAGVAATDAGSGEVLVTIPGGIGGIAIEDEGSEELAAAIRLNFVGSGVSVVDAGSGEATITVPGEGAALETIIVSISDETTAITTGTSKVTFRMPYDMHVDEVKASLTTTSSSGDPTFDVNDTGVSIFGTNKLSIDAGEEVSATATTPVDFPSGADLVEDDEISIDIDVAGTGAMGAKIYLKGYRN